MDKNWESLPIGDLIAEIGKSFIGTDYLAHGIEKDGGEKLVINLTGLDCTTLLENSLVLARCIKKGKTSFEDYQKELQFIRYRNGIIDEYPSRLHYFSDWIHNNILNCVIKDVTKSIGAVSVKFDVNFMSANPDLYKQLKENPGFVSEIKKQEEEISKREYFYIPKNELIEKEKQISNGDLIAITTTVEGLDIGHVGIAMKMENGKINLLHAPNIGATVQITEEPLSDYLQKYNRHSGVMVLRAIEQSK
jgi:hypothetical protein